ncbi:MAG: S8 family serine peptidase [Candidatus Sericytochromatia bacterium]
MEKIKIEIDSLFKSYLQEYFKILVKYQYRKIEGNGEELRLNLLSKLKENNLFNTLIDLASVVLYYGSKLTTKELINLKYEDIILHEKQKIRIKYQDMELLFDEECSAWIEEILKLKKDLSGSILLFDSYTINQEKMTALIKKYPNEEILEVLSHCFPIYLESDYEVIPTPLRLSTDMKYTGKGVTIAFIDSGFYPHPDITKPVNRVLKYVNIAEPEKDDFAISQNESWHGMQTSLSACGNGFLSGGLYRGIASEANLVLLKVTGKEGIESEDIIKAIKWCIEHKEEYNIRIINISLSENEPSSFLVNMVDQTAEAAVQAGIVVMVAVGNDGDSYNIIAPPASAPSVITVGGLDDRNDLDVTTYTMYRSSYGKTLDGLMKPEIIAPGIWVAAPILPDTEFFEETEILNYLNEEKDEKLFFETLKKNLTKLKFDETMLVRGIFEVKEFIARKIKANKIVGKYYQHVDGTSFSSPIVASVVAQMIEANPNLNPRRIKQILTQTTDQLWNIPKEKQGYGLIHARKAVKEALNDIHRIGYNRPVSPYVRKNKVTFYYVDPNAKSVAVAGSFNNWNKNSDLLVKEGKSLWKLEKEINKIGSYRYKFVIDGNIWTYDKENDNKEYDGFNGYNNILNIFV